MKLSSWRGLLALAALCGSVLASAQPAPAPAPAAAAPAARENRAQPYNNAPFYRDVRAGVPGFTQVGDDPERAVLIQSGGETWREARVPLSLVGGLMVALSLGGLGGFYLLRGTMKVGASATQQLVRRFVAADRYAHWLMAIVWVTLALTGLVLSIGKFLLLPVLGPTLFSWLATLSKYLHNLTGPILIVAIPWMFVRFVRDNGVGVEDLKWFTHILDYFKGHEYPSGKFNAGEKMVFWVVLVVLSSVLVASGLVLDFPNFGQARGAMQVANVIHMGAAYVAMAIAAVHIYLGTVGMSGAYRAMRDGYVTVEWAEHHHTLWYDEVKAGKIAASPIVAASELPAPLREAVLAADK